MTLTKLTRIVTDMNHRIETGELPETGKRNAKGTIRNLSKMLFFMRILVVDRRAQNTLE